MKKIAAGAISLLLIAIVLSLFPFVHCRATDLKTDAVTPEVIWQRNPRYKAYEDEPVPEATHRPESRAATTTFTSEEAAAKQVREYLKDREESFTITVKSKYSKTGDLIESIMEKAMEHTGDPEAGDYLAWQFEYWSAEPQTNWYGGEYTHKFYIDVEYYTTKKQEAKVDAAVKKILDELDVYDQSDYKKIRAVYDYLCENVTYDYKHLEDDTYTRKHTAYAALVDKTAVCQGYAVAMYRLLLELDVDNRVVIGISGGEDHAWNIVELGNLYYNVDATWDAENDEHKFFLRSKNDFTGHTRYLEYETFDFHDDYPMAAKSYKSGVKGTKDNVIRQGSCGDDAKWVLKRDRSLTITGKGAINDYPAGGSQEYLAPWEFWLEEIEKITVGEGITVLGENNFQDLKVIESVSLPSTLKEIRDCAFSHAEGLKEIKLPDSLVTIGASVFRECTGLKSITIPNSVKTMGVSVFLGCTNLNSVKLSSLLQVLPAQIFNDCGSLTEVSLPSKLKRIEEGAFIWCNSLTSITIPKTVELVNNDAFAFCDQLKKVTFKGTTSWELDIFDRCWELKEIHFKGDATEFTKRSFNGLTVTCYYPAGNSTWNEAVRQEYWGDVKWVAVKSAEADPPEITTQPKTKKVEAGGKAKFTVKATGTDLRYQWQYSSDGKTWKNSASSSGKKATYTFTAKTSHSSNYYRCVITDGDGNKVTTAVVRLYVLGVKTQPKAQTVESGGKVKLTVKATGAGKTYQWQYSADGKTWYNCKSSNAKDATFTFTGKMKHNGNYYRCRIKDNAGNVVYTSKVRLTVK